MDITLLLHRKYTAGKAGSGLHIHMRITKDGQNQMLKDGALSETARTGHCGHDGSWLLPLRLSVIQILLPIFRLVPHQEAPTNICWGDRNRSVLVRVPLGWSAKNGYVHVGKSVGDPKSFMILHRNRRWKCVRLTVRPICIN